MGFDTKLQTDSLIVEQYPEPSVENGAISAKGQVAETTNKIGLFKATFLVTRSLIGVGVLAQPHMNYDFGWLSI